MLKVETEILEDRQARLVVSVEPERVEKELRAAARRISRKVNISGFRKGKAPYHVIASHFGEGAIYEEAIESLGQTVYIEALEQSELNPYAPGSLDDVELDPMVLTFTVPLPPEVDLGAYREIRVPFEPPEVKDENVEQTLEQLRQDEAIMTPVERPAEVGDVVTLDVRGSLVDVEGNGNDDEDESENLLIDRRAMQIRLNQDNLYPAPGFAEKVLGMAVGDEREFDITLPDDDDIDVEMRGKTVHFRATCSEVYLNELPELDDEFAQSVGDHSSLADLKAEIRERLERAAHREARERHTDKVLEKLAEDETVRISYPPIMLDEQIDDMVTDLENRLEGQGLTLDLYLKAGNMTAEDLRESYSEDARRMLTRGLILGKIVDLERLTVDDEEVDDEIQTRLLSFGSQASLAKQVLSAPRMKKMIANELMVEKALERLALIARGEAPELEALESETQAETLEEEQSVEDAEDTLQQVESGREGEETAETNATTEQPSGEEALGVAVDDDES